MKPLLKTVVAICLLITANALPENEGKELSQSKEIDSQSEESVQQTRVERCTTCSTNLKFNQNSPNQLLAQLQNIPGAEVHTQQSFEGCSTDKGCAGIKVKDGAVVERFGNLDAFRAAAASDTNNEFTFHAAGNLGNVFQGGVPSNGPFWWMNENSPFKTGATAGGGSYANSGSLDLASNPFLNGDFSKSPASSSFQTSSFESSSYSSSNKGDVDISKNPFLNGGFNKFAGSGFQSQGGFSGSSQGAAAGGQSGAFGGSQGFESSQSSFSSGSKFSNGGGYTGSSPSPFTASTGGNVNLVQNAQKSEFEFDQQQQTQQNIDERFQSTGNVLANEHTGGELQQTCAGQGYVCVHKAQCNNGVVNTNGASILQAKTKKQYCNVKTEICCRIEISALAGTGGLQASLGGGSATYSGSQGSGIFSSSNQGNVNGAQGAQGAFGSNGFGSSSSSSSFESSSFSQTNRGNQGAQTGFNANGAFGAGTTGTGNYGTTSSANRGSTFTSSGSSGSSSNKFGAAGQFGSNLTPNRFGAGNEVYKQTSQSNFIESDSFSAGSDIAGVYRPGAVGLKPGLPYLPPVDSTNSGSNVISSTAYPSTFITTSRPFTTPKPTYLPPVSSTAAPGYLPPEVPEQTINTETRVPKPNYNDGQLILDETRQRPKQPVPFVPSEIPAGCAAALKCTPIEYCTAEGVISNTTVFLTKDQNDYRVPLTDCKDLSTGLIGKCCRDPYYTDPWPVNQLGKWVPDVFGGNDGKYTPDSRGSGSFNRPQVTARPPVTGSTLLNNFQTPKPTPIGPNQITQTSFTKGGQGQYSVGGQGQYAIGGQGQFATGGQGQYATGSRGQTSQTGGQFSTSTTQGFNQGSTILDTNRQGQFATQGQGQYEIQGQGQYTQGGKGQIGIGGQGQYEIRGQGTQGQFTQTSQNKYGQTVIQGQGQAVSQGQGLGVIRGQGQEVITGQGQGVITGTGQIIRGGGGQGVIRGGGQAVITGQGQEITTGQGQGVITGQGQTVIRGGGQGVITGQGQTVIRGGGQGVITGQGQEISQGFGQAFTQGQGFSVSQGGGYNVENEYDGSASRVFLQAYSAGGQCGQFNGQKPYGNRNDLEVDFAEIPWQAMILLQTNKSLLCGGIITRPDVVLTSAACVEGLQAKNVLIKGGEWKLGIDDEPLPFQIVQVKTIVRHPFYKRGSLLYDAAILVLTENLRFSKNIYPICLPRADETLDAFYNGAGECIVTGWGKQVLQAHLEGAIMHSINVSLLNPGECQTKLSQDYPHLLEQYNQDSCACGQPTNPINNICRVDIGSALACTTGDNHFVLRGIYSWDSGCQLGNQLAAFYKFDLEWYEWAIGLIESVRFAQFAQYTTGSQILSQNRFAGQIKGGGSGQYTKGGVNGFGQSQFSSSGSQFSSGQSQFGQFSAAQTDGTGFSSQLKGPITNSFSATYSEKKIFQTEPKIVTYTTKPEIITYTTKPEIFTYTTKPEIVTFTTKPKYFTYTTKPKIVTFTTKPQIIRYETSGSGTNPQYVAPGVTFNPSFSDVVKDHTHSATCKCADGIKK